MHRNFNLAKPKEPICLIQKALSFRVAHPVLCSTRLCPCFLLLKLIIKSQLSQESISQCKVKAAKPRTAIPFVSE